MLQNGIATKLCILVDPFLRNCVTKSNFRYFLKKAQKKALALKGLKRRLKKKIEEEEISLQKKNQVNVKKLYIIT